MFHVKHRRVRLTKPLLFHPLHDRVEPVQVDAVSVFAISINHHALVFGLAGLQLQHRDQAFHDVAVLGAQLGVIEPAGQVEALDMPSQITEQRASRVLRLNHVVKSHAHCHEGYFSLLDALLTHLLHHLHARMGWPVNGGEDDQGFVGGADSRRAALGDLLGGGTKAGGELIGVLLGGAVEATA